MNIALFPASVETLPIAFAINKYSEKYKVTTLLSLSGFSLCGKDAGFAGNRGNTGMIVSDSFEDTKGEWETVFVAEQSDINSEGNIYEHTVEGIETALSLGKQVRCSARLKDEDLMRFSKREDKLFTYLPTEELEPNTFQAASIFQPDSYVIFVGGLLYDVNGFEVFLNLYEKLRENYDVLPISTNINSELYEIKSLYPILHSKELSEVDKIYAINNYIRLSTEKKPPDIVLVNLAEPMMEYNDKLTNGFGVVPFLVSRALVPDYFICCMPYSYGNGVQIDMFSEGISQRLGFGIDFTHLSNTDIDPSVAYEFQNMTIYVPHSYVAERLKSCADLEIPVESLITESGMVRLLAEIEREINEMNNLRSIVN